MLQKRLVMSVVTAMALPLSAISQELPPAVPVERADEIVVSDERLRPVEMYQDSPVETEIITDDVISVLPGTNVAEAIKDLPGIRIQQRVQGEEAAVSIEGMPPGWTMILINDQRYAGEIGGVGDLRDFPVGNVERIEIRRGAQGLRYGPEAGGGVINIVTKDPPMEGWRAEGEFAAGDDRRIHANGTGAFALGPVGVSLTFDYDKQGGYDAPDDLEGHTLLPSGSDSTRLAPDLYGTIRYSPLTNLLFRTRIGYRHVNETFVYTDEAEAEVEDSGDVESDYKRWLVSQEGIWTIDDSNRIIGSFSFFNADTKAQTGREYTLHEDEYKLDFAFERFQDIGPLINAFTVGLDMRTPGIELKEGAFPENLADVGLKPGRVDERFWSLGVYSIVETEFSSWLSAEVGIRGQFHNKVDPQALSHGAIMFTLYEWSEERSAKLRLSAGRNYRIPTLRELYQPPVPQVGGAYFLAGNTKLKPEIATSFRAGIEANPFSWMTTSAVWFYNDINDHIRSSVAGTITTSTSVIPASPMLCDLGVLEFCEDQIQEVGSPLYVKTNLDHVVTQGLEFRVGLRPHPFVELQLGYTFLDTSVEDSNLLAEELPNEAPHVVDTRLTLEAPVTETILTVRTRWRSSAPIETSGTGLLSFTTDKYSDPSWNVDIRVVQPVFFSPLKGRVSLFFDLYNATDNRFIDSYVVRGRTFLAGLRATFD